MKHVLRFALLLIPLLAVAQSRATVPQELADGLEAFENRDFERAADLFDASIEAAGTAYDGHAQYWLGRTLIALDRLQAAADVFDLFLATYGDHPYREESAYQRARLFYLQDSYEAAIQRFASFLEEYSPSPFEANALYWSAESLLALGRLDAAETLFREVTVRFPASFRYEAAQYRLDVLELMRRENELLTLLQWSHEEYLQALDLFDRREQQYQEAINAYRNQIAADAAPEAQGVIDDLTAELSELRATVEAQQTEINDLRARLRTSGPTTGPEPAETPVEAGDAEMREALDSLRLQAQELQRLLLEQEEEQ